ncbi:4283_t:CDS:2, partial [Funneliformis geosporum]
LLLTSTNTTQLLFNNNAASFNVSPPQNNTTNQHVNPNTFIRQLQSYMGLYPFVDALSKSAGWPTTAAEQPILLSQLGEDPSMTVKLMMLFKLQQNKVVEKIIMGNISPFTPSSAPMAKHDHGTHKLLHYTNSRNGRVIGPNSTNTSSSPSLSTSPAKQLKRHNRIREMQATSFILSNSGVVSAATNSMGKCYADTVAIGNGAKKPDLIYMNTAC